MNPNRVPQGSTALEPGAVAPLATVSKGMQALLSSLRPKLAKVASKYVTPERMLHLVSLAFGRSPTLAKCSEASIIDALMIAGQMGLEPFGPLQHAALIPRYNGKSKAFDCQFQVEYRGWLELIHRGGSIVSQTAGVVYQQEIASGAFKATHWPRSLVHEVTWEHEEWPDDNLVAAYYAADLVGGGKFQIVLDRAEILKRRSASKALGADQPWALHFAPMARKSAIIAAASSGMLKLSTEGAMAVEQELRAQGGGDFHPVVLDVATEPARVTLDVEAATVSDQPAAEDPQEGPNEPRGEAPAQTPQSTPAPAQNAPQEAPLGTMGAQEKARLWALAHELGLRDQDASGLRAGIRGMPGAPDKWTAAQVRELETAIGDLAAEKGATP